MPSFEIHENLVMIIPSLYLKEKLQGMQLLGDNVCEKTKSASWTSDGGSYTLAYKKSLSSSYISPLSLTLGPAPSSKLK